MDQAGTIREEISALKDELGAIDRIDFTDTNINALNEGLQKVIDTLDTVGTMLSDTIAGVQAIADADSVSGGIAAGADLAGLPEARRPGRSHRPAQGAPLHLLLGRRGVEQERRSR